MRRAQVALTLALVAAVGAGCGDEDDPGQAETASWTVPQDGFCDDVVAEAGLDGDVEETVSGDDEDTTAACTLLTGPSRVDLVVRVADQAGDQYELSLAELEDGVTGFAEPEVSEPDGWWSEGARFEAVENDSVRLTDLLLDDTLVVRLQLVDTPESGEPAARQAAARDLADALDGAVASVLESS